MTESSPKRRFPLSLLAWLFPLTAVLLMGSILYFAQRSRVRRGDADMVRQLVRDRIDAVFRPLELTALHFETISPGISVPRETVLRHFRFLQKLAHFQEIALVSSTFQIMTHTGGEEEVFLSAVRGKKPGWAFLHLGTNAGILDRLYFGIPMTPSGEEPRWIVAQYPLLRLQEGLPDFVQLKVMENPEKSPIHPVAPLLLLGFSEIQRPLWPLATGILMLFAGFFLLVFIFRR